MISTVLVDHRKFRDVEGRRASWSGPEWTATGKTLREAAEDLKYVSKLRALVCEEDGSSLVILLYRRS